MNSIYSCTILIFILLSQLDLFTYVEGAAAKGPSGTPIVVNLDVKKNTSQVTFEENKRKGRTLYSCNDGFLIKEIKAGGQVMWKARDNAYADRVALIPDDQGKPKAKVLYPGDADIDVNQGEDLYSEAEETEQEYHPAAPKSTSSQVAKYKAMAIAERNAAAGKPTGASAAKPKVGTVQVDPQTGGKTLDIPLDSFDEGPDEEIVVVEQKRPAAKAQVVHASAGAPAGAPAGASSPRPKYSVSTEVRKVGAPAAPAGKPAKQSRSELIEQLQNMAADLTKQYEDLAAEVQRRKAGGAAPAPKAEEIDVVDDHKPEAPKVTPEVTKKPEYVTSVEVVRRPPKTPAQPPTGHAHLPADIQAFAEGAMPTHGVDAGQRGARPGQFQGDKMDLLHHKVDRVYSEVVVLRHEFARLNSKFDAFISAVSTGGSTATAARAAASLESHAKHGAGQQAGAGSDESISSYQLASQFPSGWHDHSFERSGITVDFTELPTGLPSDKAMFEVKKHGDVVTLVFNRGKRVDDIRCAGASVWELGYTRTNSTYPKASSFNKKTLKILVNLEDLVLLYERESDGKWQLAKEFKLEPIELLVKESDGTTSSYAFSADAAAGKYTYEAKAGKAFKAVKHELEDVWRAESLIHCSSNVELRKYPDNMFGLTLHFLDRSELKFVKESASTQWTFVDPSTVTPATVNVFSVTETYSYTIGYEANGVKLFRANDGFKFNRVIAKQGENVTVICETQNQLNFANAVEFDGNGATRKVILHFAVGSGTGVMRKVFEETANGWQAEGAGHSPANQAQAGQAMSGAQAQPASLPNASVVNQAQAAPLTAPPATPAMSASPGQAAPPATLANPVGQATPSPNLAAPPGNGVANQHSATPATTPPAVPATNASAGQAPPISTLNGSAGMASQPALASPANAGVANQTQLASATPAAPASNQETVIVDPTATS